MEKPHPPNGAGTVDGGAGLPAVARFVSKTGFYACSIAMLAWLLFVGPMNWPETGASTRWPHTETCGPSRRVIDACTITQLAWLWFVPLMTGIFAVILLWARAADDARRAGRADAAAAPQGHPSPSRLGPVGRLLSGQVPPTRLWANFCGGLTGGEVLAVLVWVAIQASWLYNLMSVYYPFEWSGRYMLSNKHAAHMTHPQRMVTMTIKAFGCLTFPNLVLLFLPVSRGSALLQAARIPYPAAIRFHRWVGTWITLLGMAHGLGFWGNWIAQGRWPTAVISFGVGKVNHLFGSVTMLALIVLLVTSRESVRRGTYWVFYGAHRVSFWVFIFAAVMHYQSIFLYFLPGLVFYAIDAAVRLVQATGQGAKVLDARAPGGDEGTVTLLTLDVAPYAAPEAGVVWLQVPEISLFQSHPFTCFAARGRPAGAVQVHVKAYSRWSRKLLELVRERGRDITVRAQGPYVTQQDNRHLADDGLVIVAGGIGVTEAIASLRELAPSPGLPLLFVWTARHASELLLLLPHVLEAAEAKGLALDARLHYTGSVDELLKASVAMELNARHEDGNTAAKHNGNHADAEGAVLDVRSTHDDSAPSLCPVLSFTNSLSAQALWRLSVHLLAFGGVLAAILVIRGAAVAWPEKPWPAPAAGAVLVAAIAAFALAPVILWTYMPTVLGRLATPPAAAPSDAAADGAAAPRQSLVSAVVAAKGAAAKSADADGKGGPALSLRVPGSAAGPLAVRMGRPDVEAIIDGWAAGLRQLPFAAVASEAPASSRHVIEPVQICCYAAGPEALVARAQVACGGVSGGRPKGAGGRDVFIRVVARTHSL